jgi:hypothetical protein
MPWFRWPRTALFAVACAWPASAAPPTIGPARCTGCHDHERQSTQWRTTEPARGQGRAHVNALKRLDGAKATTYARAVGLADAYDLKGSCVRCHATVFRGDANAGVSCESCHGAAGDYLDPHQQKGSYPRALSQGMRALKNEPEAIGRLCADCHRVEDRRLTAAGHPDGARWDAAAALSRIVHWTATYDPARIASAARARVSAKGGSAAAAAPATAAPRPAAEPASPAAAAPWDWSQPVQALPDDYVPPPASAPTPARSVASPAAAPRPPAPAAVPPSIAEERPAVPFGRGHDAPAVAPRAAITAAPADDPAARRGRALRALESLLRRGLRTPGAPAPALPKEFAGPDAELLRLQEEALVLALEALRRP